MLTSERREVFVSGEGNHFYQATALWKDEVSDEKHEETPWSSDSLFEKNSKFLKQQQNSNNLPPKSIFQKSKQPFALHFFLASCNLPRDDPRNFCANTRIRLFTRNDLCGPVGYHWKKDT